MNGRADGEWRPTGSHPPSTPSRMPPPSRPNQGVSPGLSNPRSGNTPAGLPVSGGGPLSSSKVPQNRSMAPSAHASPRRAPAGVGAAGTAGPGAGALTKPAVRSFLEFADEDPASSPEFGGALPPPPSDAQARAAATAPPAASSNAGGSRTASIFAQRRMR